MLIHWGAFGSGTVIGNGGDPIFEFLNATRRSLLETIRYLNNDSAELSQFCNSDQLEMKKQKFCRKFFKSISQQVIELNQGSERTKFVLKDQPLLVEGPDGEMMSVTARTSLSAEGVIEFHRDSVKTLIPTQVLFLLAHEFQHKVQFQGKFISDNEVIGPFSDGRELLDTIASALVHVAIQKGHIGRHFGIQDIFDCTVEVSGASFGARISSGRRFLSEDLLKYETSIGKTSTDGFVYVPETQNSQIVMRLEISEPNNCSEDNGERYQRLQVVRRTMGTDGTSSEQLLNSKMTNKNSMCPGVDSSFSIKALDVQFHCQYFGSTGTTSSSYSLSDIVKVEHRE